MPLSAHIAQQHACEIFKHHAKAGSRSADAAIFDTMRTLVPQLFVPLLNVGLPCLGWASLGGGGVLVGNFLPQGNPLQLRCEIPQHVIGRLFYYVASCEVPA